MDTKRIIFAVLFVLATVIAILYLRPQVEKRMILDEIDEANYCSVTADCVDAGSKCPFDCYTYVNKNEVDRISKLIDGYDSTCTYECVLCEPVCADGECQEICQ